MSSLSERVAHLGELMHQVIVTAGNFEKEQQAAVDKAAKLSQAQDEVIDLENKAAKLRVDIQAAERRLADVQAAYAEFQKKAK